MSFNRGRKAAGCSAPVLMEAMEGRMLLSAVPAAAKPPPPKVIDVSSDYQAFATFQHMDKNGIETDVGIEAENFTDQAIGQPVVTDHQASMSIGVIDTKNNVLLMTAFGQSISQSLTVDKALQSAHLKAVIDLFDTNGTSFFARVDITWSSLKGANLQTMTFPGDPGTVTVQSTRFTNAHGTVSVDPSSQYGAIANATPGPALTVDGDTLLQSTVSTTTATVPSVSSAASVLGADTPILD